jgi:hypothetical protein
MAGFVGAHHTGGTTTQKGYGAAHQKERAKWKPVVDAGLAYCRQPVCLHRTRWIPPGTAWALGHTDDRGSYLGPVHADCNQRDGARRGALIGNRRQRTRTHRWTAPSPTDSGPGPGW